MQYDAARVQFLANCTEIGLLHATHHVTSYGVRKAMATHNVQEFGYDTTRKLMVRHDALTRNL